MQRDLALDALRAVAIVGMLIVNLQGSHKIAFEQALHPDWHGLTVADFVFPFFLVAVGASAPLALDRPGADRSWARIARRAALRFAIGLYLGWITRPTLEFDEVRIAGVLQRIAIVYLACAIFFRLSRGWIVAAAAAALFLAVHTWLLLAVPAPGEAIASIAKGEGLNAWLDQQYLPGRILRGTFDPEGILSTLPAIASGLIGVAVSRAGFLQRGAVPMALTGAVLVALAVAANQLVPFNKQLWTASFALVTGGSALLVWAGFRAVWPSFETRGGAWLAQLGRSALTLYVIHGFLLAFLVLPPYTGEGGRSWAAIFRWMESVGLGGPWGSMGFALLAATLCIVLTRLAVRNGYELRV
jgi:predicted acyltransferase